MPSIPEEAITTREAAKLLDISLRTAQLWVESGVLKAWKTAGGHRRILKSSVDQLLSQRVEATSTKATPSGEHEYKILVVEDDPALLRLYELTISGWQPPAKVFAVSNGWEAMLVIGRDQPDLLITDLKLPGMDGFRMVRMLKADPKVTPKMDVIVVTGLDRSDIEAFGGLPEGVPVLQKPLSFTALEKLVIEKQLTLSGKLSSPQTPAPEAA